MQPDLQFYIDTYSNLILNHLLLAENPTGINIIELTSIPNIKVLPTGSNELHYSKLDYLFSGYVPIEIGHLTTAKDYEISLFFMCNKDLKITTKEVLYNSHYQLTGKDFLIMTLYTGENSKDLSTTDKLSNSSLLTCSLNLTLNQNFKIYEELAHLIRHFVIRFYAPSLNQLLENHSDTSTDEASTTQATAQ